jgi:photosystem II stability/assembly factor-like uncharacterized protein
MPFRRLNIECTRRLRRWAVAALGLFALQCAGKVRSGAELEAVRCDSWKPSSAAWSSLATSRPANMSSVSAAADARFLYGVGQWLNAGALDSGVFRSADLGISWCQLHSPAPPGLVVPSPAASNVLYLVGASPTDGTAPSLSKTNDGGATWTSATLPGSGVLLPSSTDPDRVWLNGTSQLFLSTDGAATWSSVAFPAELHSESDPTALDAIYSVLIDSRSAGRVLVCGVGFDIGSGLRCFTTEDAGQTWREIFPNAEVQSGLMTSAFVSDGSSLWVTGSDGLLYRSDDWAQTWATVGPLPASQVTLFASSAPGQLSAWSPAGPAYWRSLDGGSTWAGVPLPGPTFQPLLALGGDRDLIVGELETRFVSSADAGVSWLAGPILPDNSPGSAFSALVESPFAEHPFWTTATPNLGSKDGGLTWIDTGVSGQIVTDGASSTIFSVSDTAVQRSDDGGKNWAPITLPPDIFEIQAVASCPAPRSCFYGLFARPNDALTYPSLLARSDDRGASWASQVTVSDAHFYRPAVMVVAPDSPDHVLVSCDAGLCETHDGGQSWTSLVVNPHAVATGDPVEPFNSTVVNVVFMPGGTVLAATGSLGNDPGGAAVMRSTDGGVTWTLSSQNAGFLVASFAHPDTAFLLGANLLRSTDRGSSWKSFVPSNLENFAVLSGIADAPGGGFVGAVSGYGLVHFE